MTAAPKDYFTTRPTYGDRTERVFSTQEFTKDLCKAMGGTYEEPDKAEAHDAQTWGRFFVDGLRLTVYRSYGHKLAQVGLSITDPAVGHEVQGYFYGSKYKLPEVTVSASRPLDQLARDVRKRLIDAAQAPLGERRKVQAQHDATKAGVTQHVEAMRKDFPGMRIEPARDGTVATFSNSAPYFSGRINSDGSITLDHAPSFTRETFGELVRIVTRKRGEG